MRRLLLLSLVALLSLPTIEAITDSLVVRVSGGFVQGAVHKGSVHYLGIPYGSAQRFQFPTLSATRWPGIRNASLPGPQCPQRCPPVIRDLYCLPDSQVSESCLLVNVFHPGYNLPSGQLFPVMVFIHGGGFESGSGAAPLYNGDYLARVGGVIVVTINYRLGALGFLPIFNGYDDVIGNFGFRDQQVALQWVKSNIAAFDGDANKVTLVGAEAGCQSVGLHLTSFTSRTLFHSAIMHSCPFTLPFRGKNESRQMAKDFAVALGCQDNDITCMRKKSVPDILRAQERISDEVNFRSPSLRKFEVWGPIVDMRTVHDSNLLEEMMTTLLVRNSAAASKPVLMGFVSQEGRTSVYRNFPLPVSNNFFQRLIEAELPDNWRQVAETPESPYHTKDRADARAELVRFLNDFVYICPARKVAAQLGSSAGSENGEQNVWLYDFDPKVMWSPGGSSWPPGGESYCQNDACQGLGLLYLFSPTAIPESKRAPTEGLRRTMVLYWTNFVKYHNPNGPKTSSVASQQPQPSRGSVLLARGSTTLQQLNSQRASSLAPRRSFNSPASFGGLIQSAALASGRFSPSAGSPQLQERLSYFNTRQTFSSAVALASMFSQFRRSTPTPPATRSSRVEFIAWPSYVTGGAATSSGVTLLLTQPSPVVRESLFEDICKFWDIVGFA
ncbi:cAMP-regulated D2 protein-like [Littorina saxatilis]|uniref:Carboxylesterase type B domain-containing protein n=1 Tax=Littorina saxatilis TaxID=31220 RepID=A0AAN9B5S3_9CAEN